MTARPYPRLQVLSQIFLFILISSCTAAWSAIGIYNFAATAAESGLPVQIDYRLNCDGEVSIDIQNRSGAVVATLGPYTEAIGTHTHTWDNGGVSLPAGDYKAVIRASNDGGSPTQQGTLVSMFPDKPLAASIYGLNIDRFPESPAYGTIYIGQATNGGGGRLLAYYADGTPKNWTAPGATDNALALNLTGVTAKAPWGIGIDRSGNIYVSCSVVGMATSGVHVFDHQGNKLPYVLQTDPSGIVWLDGLATASGLEVYETKGRTVRYSALPGDQWTVAMDPGLTGSSIYTKGVCFETGGSACYVATCGTADPGMTNPGVTRFVRQIDGSWTKDTSFDPGLSGIQFGSFPAARHATGVSCDARDPDGAGPYTATTLWVGLATNSTYGGNIARKMLPNGETTLFTGPAGQARFVAADSVGNIAYEHTQSSTTYLWSWWGMKAPGGEPSSDVRSTNWVALAGTAQRKNVETILDLKQESAGSEVQLSSARCVTAVFAGCFYLEEDDRSSGIRVECATPVTEGSYVRVGGTMDSDMGERFLADAEIIGP